MKFNLFHNPGIARRTGGQCRFAVVFPDLISHADIRIDGCNLLAAGYVTAKGVPYGTSLSTGLSSMVEISAGPLAALFSGSEALVIAEFSRAADLTPGLLLKQDAKGCFRCRACNNLAVKSGTIHICNTCNTFRKHDK